VFKYENLALVLGTVSTRQSELSNMFPNDALFSAKNLAILALIYFLSEVEEKRTHLTTVMNYTGVHRNLIICISSFF
jgi:hypothetical protein